MRKLTRAALHSLLIAWVIVIGAFAGCTKKHEHVATETVAQKQAAVYTCPMHPSVVSDKPGSCPICGMTLVKRETAAASDTGVALSPEQRLTANVRTVKVEADTHTGELVTTGRVTFDERRLAQVTAYTAGRIERLLVNFTGDSVRRGETVATIYSPDLFATQQEHLVALRNRERMRGVGLAGASGASEELLQSTRRRLQLLGMSSGQIAQLEKTGRAMATTNIVSPVSGIVTKKNVVPQQYVTEGQPLLDVADLSSVWVEADVYEQQLADMRIGQRVSITSPAVPGAFFPGTVSFIQPVLTGETRTARVRIELANPGQKLKPDMYVSVRVYGAPQPAHIMVPKSAVVDRGQKQFVWLESAPGKYGPREVKVGPRHGEQLVILSGVDAGDTVVVEGGFLLDSEAQLRSATASDAHQEH